MRTASSANDPGKTRISVQYRTKQGKVYEFTRGNQWRARNPFNTTGTQSYRRNQFGGSLGGPLRRNSTYFFGNYEGLRQEQTETRLSALPSAAMWKR